MPISLDPLPPGLEGAGYAAGATVPRPVLQPPVVGALRPEIVPASYSPMDLVARARDRFLSLFQSPAAVTAAPVMPLTPAPNRTAQLESNLNDLERRSTTVKDLRLANALANAR